MRRACKFKTKYRIGDKIIRSSFAEKNDVFEIIDIEKREVVWYRTKLIEKTEFQWRDLFYTEWFVAKNIDSKTFIRLSDESILDRKLNILGE